MKTQNGGDPRGRRMAEGGGKGVDQRHDQPQRGQGGL